MRPGGQRGAEDVHPAQIHRAALCQQVIQPIGLTRMDPSGLVGMPVVSHGIDCFDESVAGAVASPARFDLDCEDAAVLAGTPEVNAGALGGGVEDWCDTKTLR